MAAADEQNIAVWRDGLLCAQVNVVLGSGLNSWLLPALLKTAPCKHVLITGQALLRLASMTQLQGFIGADALGAVVVSGVPNMIELRGAVLHHAAALQHLPAETMDHIASRASALAPGSEWNIGLEGVGADYCRPKVSLNASALCPGTQHIRNS